MTNPPAADPGTAPGAGLDHVEAWIFDLDNTLYPASCNLFAQVDRRIGAFVGRLLSLDPDQARQLQTQYFREHGTTLRGLMTVNGIEPEVFLDYVHDIDVSPVPPNPALDRALDALDGRKLVFTNGSQAHAERILDRLGVARRFEAIVDIVASDYVPKPDRRAYDRMIAAHGVVPGATAMVEDIAVNLIPAHALGMTTVWVRTEHPWMAPAPGDRHVHHVVDDLTEWLSGVAAARRRRASVSP